MPSATTCSDCNHDNAGIPTWLQRPLVRAIDETGARQICTYCLVALAAAVDTGRIDLTVFISPVAVTA